MTGQVDCASLINRYPSDLDLDEMEGKLDEDTRHRVHELFQPFIGDTQPDSLQDSYKKYLNSVKASLQSTQHPFVEAVKKGNQKLIEKFLGLQGLGFDINCSGRDGKTAGHAAASLGKIDLLALLKKSGLDLEKRDHFSNTPLHDSVQARKLESVTWLIDEHVNLDPENKGSLTPLQLATSDRLNKIRDTLLNAGAEDRLE